MIEERIVQQKGFHAIMPGMLVGLQWGKESTSACPPHTPKRLRGLWGCQKDVFHKVRYRHFPYNFNIHIYIYCVYLCGRVLS